MTVVHAVWSGDDRLLLWAERPLRGPDLPRPRGRAPRDGRPRRHPYALTAGDLGTVVDDLTGGSLSARVATREVRLRLPSDATSPLPSPGLAGATIAHGRPAVLRTWRVDALALDGLDAFAVATVLRHGREGDHRRDHDVRTGAGVRAVSMLASLADELVARGRVLPGLVVRAGRAEARWLPVLEATDRQRLTTLVGSMPAALLADADEDHRAAGTVMRELVEQQVDAACRTLLGPRPLSRARRGPAAAWVRALTTDDPVVDHPDTAALQLLAKELDAWRRSGTTAAAPMRAVFRLAAPEDGEDGDDAGPWRLDFALQATDDPSLLVPAADVWASRHTSDLLDRMLESPEERLLTDLGRARRLYPQLDRALDTPEPDGLDLDVDEVVAFLRDTAPLLEQAGFGVLLPDQLRRPRRLAARLRTRNTSSTDSGGGPSVVGRDGILDYQWQVALGDQTLTADELEQLAALKAPLVRFRGQWVELREEDVAAAVRLLQDPPTGEMDVGDAVRIGLGLADPDLGLPVDGVDAEDDVLPVLLGDGPDRRLAQLDTPTGLDGTLRPYQARGLSWLAFLRSVGLGGCLADDMGLGKSVQLLALLVHERDGTTRRSRHRPAPTLLVCPMSIVGNWEREAARFAPGLRVVVHHGRERAQGDELAEQVAGADLVITTYSLAARDRDDLANVGWGRIVLDEAQNIKNPGTRQARAIRSLEAPQRLALTGTPVENRLSELWSIMDFCNPGLLGSRAAFREAFAIPIERLHDDEAAARLRRVTGPFVLRRTKTDRSIIADLPDKIEFDERCNLTREQASLYAAVVEDMMQRIAESDGIERRGLVLQTMMRLKQVCNHPAHLLADGSRLPGRSGKLERLDGLVDEVLDAGEKVLVFTQFAQWGQRMQDHLQDRLGRDVAFLHGGVGKARRDRMVEAFQDPNGPSVFLLSLKAGGVGLNLTAANHVVHFDRWWNPAVENQATDRAFRIGQRRDVVVRRFVCAGTLEERIAQLIEAKRDLAERAVGTGEGWLTELSTDELRDVVRLGADAVGE